MATHPSGKNRNKRQKLKATYSKVREDAQLYGIIPTTPEGAVHSEVVSLASQSEQSIPSIDRQAITKGWEVPEHAKQKVIQRLLEPFFQEPKKEVLPDGTVVEVPPDRHLLKENAKVLVVADQRQWERDYPKLAGQSKGASQVTQQTAVVVDPLALFKQLG
jgi:hypothetical protein